MRIEENSRLIRCKDCHGAFHLNCMLIHGGRKTRKEEEGNDDEVGRETGSVNEGEENDNDGEEEEDRKMPAVDTTTATNTNANNDEGNDTMEEEEEHETRDPKRCYKCQVQ